MLLAFTTFVSIAFSIPLVIHGANPFLDGDVWVAKIDEDVEKSRTLAEKHGFQIISKVEFDEDVYVLKRNSSIFLRRDSEAFENEEEVDWIEQQYPLKRSKRQMYSWLESRYKNEFNDILWSRQWYLQDYREKQEDHVTDLNVVPCYREGITGKGIRIAVIDDGLESTHLDLKDNFSPELSYDYVLNRSTPIPPDKGATHGTECAGVIAMSANNGLCGVGVAYDAKIGGIRLLDGDANDLLEGQSLSHRTDLIDIYSCSWGPDDNGEVMEGPGKSAQSALMRGIIKGRQGKGAIYIYAGGNGKTKGDNCGADGFVNSMFTIAIAGASQGGKTVFYSERCAAILATAYSSGSVISERVSSTTVGNKCTVDFDGTSAATPLAAGIVALVLQANPELTWRDVQHLIVWTSEVYPLSHNKGWHLNGRNLWVSHDFGFGLMNAHAMVTAARNFTLVSHLLLCRVKVVLLGDLKLKKGGKVVVKFYTTGCRGTKSEVRFLEHVQLTAYVPCNQRGALRFVLTSPSGTDSILLEERNRDQASSGALVKREWTMDSVHFWGEDPAGIWTLTVEAKDLSIDNDDFFSSPFEGFVSKVRASMYGTRDMPDHYKVPRKYSAR